MVSPLLTYQARRTPSFLAGLLDQRARADGQVSRLSAMLVDIQNQLDTALSDRDASDVLIARYYAGVDVNAIPPIAGTLGRHGPRGTVIKHIRRVLADAGPNGATTTEVGAYLAGALGIEFATTVLRTRWLHTSVLVRLRQQVATGEFEAMHKRGATGKPGRWRLAIYGQAKSTVAELAATATTGGVKVEFIDDADDDNGKPTGPTT